jgi:hypothetical protein
MTDVANDYISEIQRKVAASDAQANADLADIMAGRPYKRQTPKPKAETADGTPAAEKKPRAKRAPKKRPPINDDE